MACRFNRSIPAHSIPAPPSLCGLSSPVTPLPAVACFPAPVGLRLAVLVLVGASSARFQLSAGRCRAVFAFPVRCEVNIFHLKNKVNKIFKRKNICYKKIRLEEMLSLITYLKSTGHKKSPSRGGAGRHHERYHH